MKINIKALENKSSFLESFHSSFLFRRLRKIISSMGKICEFFSGKNVLVTGATGFCGKILVAKLIKDFEKIGKIFIIVRQKKNGNDLKT